MGCCASSPAALRLASSAASPAVCHAKKLSFDCVLMPLGFPCAAPRQAAVVPRWRRQPFDTAADIAELPFSFALPRAPPCHAAMLRRAMCWFCSAQLPKHQAAATYIAAAAAGPGLPEQQHQVALSPALLTSLIARIWPLAFFTLRSLRRKYLQGEQTVRVYSEVSTAVWLSLVTKLTALPSGSRLVLRPSSLPCTAARQCCSAACCGPPALHSPSFH